MALEVAMIKIKDLELPQLADCFFTRDVEAPSYNVEQAHLYRLGDAGLRMARKASALFAQIDEPGGCGTACGGLGNYLKGYALCPLLP